jgi:FAD:protein FMN transferase
MRSADRTLLAGALSIVIASASLSAADHAPVHQSRYCMGTMFDVLVYHPSRVQAEAAVEKAMAEIIRLDRVMSHFREESDLSRLNRNGSRGYVAVEPSLHDVIQEAIAFSRRSRGKFDVTIAPLLRTWKQAEAEGRMPSDREISDAMRCIGYEHIETISPDRVRFHSDCLEIDLGGIGKGYAVDRAIAVLASEGIRHALVNAGGSTIAAIGTPPGTQGWPVRLGASLSGRRILVLQDGSISTSQQKLFPLPFAAGGVGEILDPHTGVPAEGGMIVSVVAPSATAADALSTTLLLFPVEEAGRLLEQFPGVAAVWITPGGTLQATYRDSQLQLADLP